MSLEDYRDKLWDFWEILKVRLGRDKIPCIV